MKLEDLPTATSLDSTTTGRRHNNLRAVERFFQLFQRDRAGFLALWSDDPVVEIPFAPPGLPRTYRTTTEFLNFWDPIFQSFRGKFDWTVVELIVAEDPDTIVALTKSDVDVVTPMGPLKYQGEYIQIFRFKDGKVREFREYIDSAAMSKIYGFG